MSDSNDRFDRTRRSVLRLGAGLLGTAAAGAAGAHPGSYQKGGSNSSGPDGEHDHGDVHAHRPLFDDAMLAGYHSVGGEGRAGVAGRPRQRHDGDRTVEMRARGDVAVVAFRNSSSEDPGRRMATLDVSEFNDAETAAELEEAEFTVLSILRNINAAANGATDLKLSRDGNYAFLGTEALTPVASGSNGKMRAGNPRSKPQGSGGVVAVDISNPGDPTVVDSLTEVFSTGVHNLDHHRIGGTDYVFACKDDGLIAPDSGVYVARFERDPGKFVLVNRWTADGNAARGGVGAEHGLSYVHDVAVHDDPRTGRPTAYVADWDRGLRVLDASDPQEMIHVGQFDMNQSHFTTPFPDTVEMPNGETKRVAVTSHEEPHTSFDQESSVIYNTPHQDKTNPNSTGTVFLVDCDGIYPEDGDDARSAGDGPKQLGELDNWTLKNADTDPGVSFADIEQATFSFTFSPHNSEVAKHTIDGEERFVVHQSHYHDGVRFLEVTPGTGDGLTGKDRRDYRPKARAGDVKGEKFGWINNSSEGWSLAENGHGKPMVPEASGKTPDFWSAVEHNGVTYAADRGAGAFAVHHDDIPLADPRPRVDVSRSDAADLYTAGQTVRVTIDLTTSERSDAEAANLLVRDRVPSNYEVTGGDASETYAQGVRTAVEFQQQVPPGVDHELTYFVEVPAEPGPGTFGPVEVSADGGDTWIPVGGTDTNASTGASQ